MKTEVIVIRLTKQERAVLEAKKTTPLLADWIKTLAFAAPNREQQESHQLTSNTLSADEK